VNFVAVHGKAHPEKEVLTPRSHVETGLAGVVDTHVDAEKAKVESPESGDGHTE